MVALLLYIITTLVFLAEKIMLDTKVHLVVTFSKVIRVKQPRSQGSLLPVPSERRLGENPGNSVTGKAAFL